MQKFEYYHGTSTVFLDSIKRTGLGGINPNIEWNLHAPETPNRVLVPCYTDFKVHDISSGPADPNNEVLDMNAPLGSPAMFAGNSRFLTRRLWDVGNKPNYFHHGKFTTLRQAIANHFGEAEASRASYDALPEADRACVIEFLKSLQVLDVNTRSRVVDENGRPRLWPPFTPGRSRNR